jgi:hypothetical protein
MIVEFLPAAKSELLHAVAYYEGDSAMRRHFLHLCAT